MVKNIFILDEHLKTTKVLTVNGKNTFFDDIYTLDLSTGTETYEFSTSITEIDESDYVMFYYHGKYKLFQIVEITQEHDNGNIITTVYAETACLELLNDVVRSFNGEYNAISFLEHVLAGTGWSIGKYSSSLADKVVNINVDKTTQKWSCIQDYMGDFGYEISPYVIYDNGYVKSKVIDVYNEGELGEQTHKRFEYGRNVSGMVKKKDLYEWCTALIIDTDKDISDITYNKDGYVKRAGSDVVLATNENSKYNLGRDYIYSNFEPNNCNDGTDAVAKAIEELKRRATPRFDYECTTALTYEEYDDLNIGDTVYCIDNTFSPPITLEARVGQLELSFTDRTKCKCTLSNYKEVKSKINIELTGNVRDIVNSYFPITSEGIADGAITDGKIDTTYYQQITADIVSAGKVVTEELIAKEVIAIDGKFENLDAKYATIEDLNATNLEVSGKATIANLEATNAEIENLNAIKANIIDLNATNANVQNLNAIKANITDLDAANANIQILNGQVADIKTLVNGNLTSDNIQSLNLTAANTTIANALIKDAMIETVSANKINAGTINTNNVKIQSADGSMVINGTTQQFKDENNKVRIQIGKDASGNFTFVLFSQDGKGVLLDETGIHSGAVPDGLIVDNMVSDNANISGDKLDISSVISSINGNVNTLKASKIKFDDTAQTLEVAFNQLKTKVETIENVAIDGDLSSVMEQVTTNTTNIQVAQGQISSLISNTTITKKDGTVVQLKDAYNSTVDTVNSHSTKIGALETNYNKVTGNVAEVASKQSALEQNLEGFKTTVSNTYTTKSDFNNLKIGGTNLFIGSKDFRNWTYWYNNQNWGLLDEKWNGFTVAQRTGKWSGLQYRCAISANKQYTLSAWVKSPNGANCTFYIDGGSNSNKVLLNPVPTEWTRVSVTSTISTSNDGYWHGRLENSLDGKTLQVCGLKLEEGNKATTWSPAPEDIDSSINTVDVKFTNYSTTSQMNSAIKQKADEINSTVSKTYATKTSVTDLSNNLTNNYSTTMAMNSAIDQKSNEILSAVSETYTTQAEFDGLSIGGRNYIKGGKGDIKAGFFKNFSKVENGYGEHSLTSQKTYVNVDIDPGFVLGCRDYEVGKQVTFSYEIMYTDWTFPSGTNRNEFWIGQRYSTTSKSIDGEWRSVTKHNLPVVGQNGCELNKWFKVERTMTIPEQADSSIGTQSLIRFYNSNADISASVTFRIRNVKLEYGNKATDWSPAPEDIDASITTVVDNKLVNYSTTTQMNSTIDQKANEIRSAVSETYATKISVTDLNNNLTNNYSTTTAMNSAINQKANEITSTVKATYTTKSEFNGLTIGGRNLALQTNQGSLNWNWSMKEGTRTVESITEDGINCVKFTKTPGTPQSGWSVIEYNKLNYLFKPATEYVVSFEVKSNRSGNLYVELKEGNANNNLGTNAMISKEVTNDGKWCKIISKITTYSTLPTIGNQLVYINGMNNTDNSYYIIRNLMVEEGNKPTSWSPAPEDIDASIENIDGYTIILSKDTIVTRLDAAGNMLT